MKNRGASIIQTAITIALLILLAGAAWVWWQHEQEAANPVTQTRQTLNRLVNVFNQYQQATGNALPAEGTAYVKAFLGVESLRPTVTALPGFDAATDTVRDAWGNPIGFHVRPNATCYFQSAGPDGKAGTSDDLFSDMP